MCKRILVYIALAACYLVVQSGVAAAAESPDVQVTPNLVSIGATYNGANVSVEGTIPADAAVVVEMEGKESSKTLMKKEHVFGVLWMDSGAITFAGVPNVYMVNMPAEFCDASLHELQLGLSAMKDRAKVTPTPENREKIVEDFIKLKQKDGLYAVREDAVQYTSKTGAKEFSTRFRIPPKMPLGSYTLKTSVLQGGSVLRTVTNTFKVEESGLPAFITALAFNHSIIYGVLAVIIAVLAGLLMSYIFKGGEGAH